MTINVCDIHFIHVTVSAGRFPTGGLRSHNRKRISCRSILFRKCITLTWNCNFGNLPQSRRICIPCAIICNSAIHCIVCIPIITFSTGRKRRTSDKRIRFRLRTDFRLNKGATLFRVIPCRIKTCPRSRNCSIREKIIIGHCIRCSKCLYLF